MAETGDPTLVAAPVLRCERTRAVVLGPGRETSARIGRDAADVTVGEWVALAPARDANPATIVTVLPRRGVIARKASGATHRAQTLAANVDVAFVLAPLDAAANARKIERFLALARDGGVEPVVVLAKCDFARDLEAERRAAEASGLDATFADVAALARACRFRDCAHETEPECAVRRALESGDLDPGRYESFLRLRREAAFAVRKGSERREESEPRLGRAGSKLHRGAAAYMRWRLGE